MELELIVLSTQGMLAAITKHEVFLRTLRRGITMS